MEEMAMSESLKKLIAELQDKETNEIYVGSCGSPRGGH